MGILGMDVNQSQSLVPSPLTCADPCEGNHVSPHRPCCADMALVVPRVGLGMSLALPESCGWCFPIELSCEVGRAGGYCSPLGNNTGIF